MHVEIVDSYDGLLALRRDWDAVHAAAPDSRFFASFLWISEWYRRSNGQWLVLAAKDSAAADSYVGFCPLQLRTDRRRDGGFFNQLIAGGGYFAGYNNLLILPGRRGEAARAFAQAIQQLNWSHFHLDNLAGDPATLRLFLKGFRPAEFAVETKLRPDDGDGVDQDIFTFVDLPDDWETFLTTKLGYSTRYNARRTLRQIDAGDEYRVTLATAETFERDLEVLLQLWRRQWAEKNAARYGAATPAATVADSRDMLRACFQAGAVLLPVLWRGEAPIAAQGKLIDRKNGALIGLMGARDLTVRKPAPGFATHLYCLRWAIGEGLKTYDFLNGDYGYKFDFGAQEQRFECTVVRTHDRANLRGALEPRSAPVVLEHARAFQRAGRTQEARNAVRQVLEATPQSAAARSLLAEIDGLPPPAPAPLAVQLRPAAPLSLAEQIRRATQKPSGPG